MWKKKKEKRTEKFNLKDADGWRQGPTLQRAHFPFLHLDDDFTSLNLDCKQRTET